MIAAAQAFSPRRLAGSAAVLVLHLLVIAGLLSGKRLKWRPATEAKEIILNLIAPKVPPNLEAKSQAAQKQSTHKAAQAFVPPPTFTPPPATAAPQLGGLNHQLFGCTPDQLATATPEERAACASASLGPRYDPGAADYRDHTDRSVSAAQWTRDRARKNAPLLLPCMSPQGFSPLYTALCAAK